MQSFRGLTWINLTRLPILEIHFGQLNILKLFFLRTKKICAKLIDKKKNRSPWTRNGSWRTISTSPLRKDYLCISLAKSFHIRPNPSTLGSLAKSFHIRPNPSTLGSLVNGWSSLIDWPSETRSSGPGGNSKYRKDWLTKYFYRIDKYFYRIDRSMWELELHSFFLVFQRLWIHKYYEIEFLSYFLLMNYNKR